VSRSSPGGAPRFLLEVLETRALLSGIPVLQPAHVGMSSIPIAIAPTQVEIAGAVTDRTVAVESVAITLPTGVLAPSGAGLPVKKTLAPVSVSATQFKLPQNVVQVQPERFIGPTPPMVVIIGSRAASAPPASGTRNPAPPTPTNPAVPGLPSQAAANQQAESANAGTPTNYQLSPSPTAPPTAGLMGPVPTQVTGPVAPEAVQTPAPVSEPPVASLGASLSVTSKRTEIGGTLDPGHQSETIAISVGSTTQSFALVVHSGGGAAGGLGAVVAQLTLESSDGTLIEQVGPDWAPGSGAPQSLAVALSDAPVGARLVVQITTADNSSSSPTDAASPDAAGGASASVPFVLEVERLDVQTSAQQSASAPTVWVGGLGSTPNASSSTETAIAISASPTESPGLSSVTDEAPVISSSSTATASVSGSGSLDELSGPISTGPLTSRTAGPIGPIVTNLGGDLTPPVDRYERALTQDIDERSSDDDDGASASGVRVASTDSPTSAVVQTSTAAQGHRTDEPVVAVTGAGGFRLKVTGLGRAPHAASEALLAALPDAPNAEAPPSDTRPASVPDLALGGQVGGTDRSECPDYVKAACGLALGLGLATGPLLADLFAQSRWRRPKWLKSLASEKPAGAAR
jgi:hypothetical protein